MTTSDKPAASSQDLASYEAFTEALVGEGLWLRTGVPGVYGATAVFDDVVEGLQRLVTETARGDRPDRVRFPPVLNRKVFEETEYMESFPQLAGVVFSFAGDDKKHATLIERVRSRDRWGELLEQTGVVLTPAACYPLYATCAGTLKAGGRLVDLASWCFRHEPSPDPARLQMFRMRELVRLGEPEAMRSWRDQWVERGLELMTSLGLPARVADANDPFFGRGGRMLAANQRDQQLKFEIIVPICSQTNPTAIMSFNYHQDHFGKLFGIHSADGQVAHTACLGFGIERIVLALFKVHGLDPSSWPEPVRRRLLS